MFARKIRPNGARESPFSVVRMSRRIRRFAHVCTAAVCLVTRSAATQQPSACGALNAHKRLETGSIRRLCSLRAHRWSPELGTRKAPPKRPRRLRWRSTRTGGRAMVIGGRHLGQQISKEAAERT